MCVHHLQAGRPLRMEQGHILHPQHPERPAMDRALWRDVHQERQQQRRQRLPLSGHFRQGQLGVSRWPHTPFSFLFICGERTSTLFVKEQLLCHSDRLPLSRPIGWQVHQGQEPMEKQLSAVYRKQTGSFVLLNTGVCRFTITSQEVFTTTPNQAG